MNPLSITAEHPFVSLQRMCDCCCWRCVRRGQNESQGRERARQHGGDVGPSGTSIAKAMQEDHRAKVLACWSDRDGPQSLHR